MELKQSCVCESNKWGEDTPQLPHGQGSLVVLQRRQILICIRIDSKIGLIYESLLPKSIIDELKAEVEDLHKQIPARDAVGSNTESISIPRSPTAAAAG
jgi:hypothetical protein